MVSNLVDAAWIRTIDGAEEGRAGAPAARPVVFLDIDGVLNTSKHARQIHLEPDQVKRLKFILETTDAVIVLTTFWRHFHEYIAYVLHRHGIDVGRHMSLPRGVGATVGKQCTKNFARCHHRGRKMNGGGPGGEQMDENSNEMIGRSAEDETEYSSRAEEIEAWLRKYGEEYLGSGHDGSGDHRSAKHRNDASDNSHGEYQFHPTSWRYVILDDRPSAAKPGTPLYNRFVFTETTLGLTEEDSERAIRLLRFGPSHKE